LYKRKQQDGIRALKRFTYKDPENGQMRNVSTAQAIAAIESTGGDVDKAFELLKDAEIAFKGEGTVAPIQYQTSGAFDLEADKLKEDKEERSRAPFDFSYGREERVVEETKTMLDKMGISTEGYKTPVGLPEVSGVQVVSTKTEDGDEITAVKTGQAFRINANGEKETRTAILGKDSIMYVVNEETTGLVPADSNEWQGFEPAPTTQMVKEDPSSRETQENYIKEYFGDTYQAQAKEFNEQRAALNKLATAYMQMKPIALDRKAYSKSAQFIGNITKRVGIEIEGLSHVIGFGDEKYDASKAIAELDTFISQNQQTAAEDIAVKSKVLEAMVTRSAYAFLQANGDTRPSDADLRRAMLQFSASSPEEFYEKAQSNWSELTTNTQRMRDDLLDSPAFKAVNVLDYTDTEKKQIQDVIDLYMPKEIIIEKPDFLDRPIEEVVKDEPDVTAEDEENTFNINVNGKTAKATYDPDRDEFVVNIGGKTAKATYDPDRDEFVVNIGGIEMTMSSEEARKRRLVTEEQLKGN